MFFIKFEIKNMKIILRYLALFFLFLLFINFTHCKSDEPVSPKQPWDQITIHLDGQQIMIGRQKSAAVYSRILTPKDTSQDFVLSDVEKDSVYNLVHDLIQKPVIPDTYINAGDADDVSFSIFYKQVDLTADYKFLKSWRNLSDKTKALYLLLSRKITFLK